MNPITGLKLAGAVALLLALLAVCWKVNVWHERAVDRDRLQSEYSAYRLGAEKRVDDINKQLAETARRKKVNDEISASYVAVIQQQSADLADAHTRLAGIRVRVGACSAPGGGVPAAAAAGQATAGTPAESADRQPFVVDAAGVADRLAACDAVGARLNALIEWHEKRQEASRPMPGPWITPTEPYPPPGMVPAPKYCHQTGQPFPGCVSDTS